MLRFCLCLFFTLISASLTAANSTKPTDLLRPVKTESPQDTMKTFLGAMNEYKVQLAKNESDAAERAINRAIRTLDLSETSLMLRTNQGREAAVFLKEVIDRVIVINYDYIPPGPKAETFDGQRWRLKNTEIVIAKQTEGERQGEFLFSADTVTRAEEFYDLVKDLPYLSGSGGGAGYRKPWLERQMPDWLGGEWFGYPKWQMIGLFIAILAGLLVKQLGELLLRLAKRLAKGSKSQWDDQLLETAEGPIGYVMASGLWFLSLYLLRLEGIVLNIFATIVQLVFSMALIWLVYRLSDLWSRYLAELASRTETELDDMLVPLFQRAIRIFVLVFGVLIAIQNLGVNVMSLIAGLGLGGLAFALAAKDTAANLFGSIMIFTDQPFRVGDWIKFAGVEGTVEEVGFRSTRIRTFYDSLITVPNAVIANANIDNLGRRQYRRVKATIGLTYGTSPEALEAFLEGAKKIIQANASTRKDYFHVVFEGYGAYSLDIMLYFFLKVPSWADELVERQNIYLELMRLAKELKVDFAFPTQTLHVQQESPKHELQNDSSTMDELRTIAMKFAKGGNASRPQGVGLFIPPHREP